ncbi:hypothetical protein C5467_02360 [Photorhabdus khanii subsp. guanajuatensis]|uniref:Uncharacterized protein n=1 Tax=Photorhabdus khanii subsp. guanajuatensis TaxID=2100166 RepID=A0A4R4K8S9_9GAMM|nr:hypothetical protein C5467_02360 [Photorhabdus khanii subsp. guanajuatensis]
MLLLKEFFILKVGELSVGIKIEWGLHLSGIEWKFLVIRSITGNIVFYHFFYPMLKMVIFK